MEELVKFECQPNCGKCCTGSGYVYLNDADVERLAVNLHWSLETFKLKFCERTGELLHLKITDRCAFLDGWKCTVQEFKPTQCRTFPFWPGNTVEAVKSWCPGAGVGKEYSKAEIEELEVETAKVIPGYQLISK